MTMDDTQKLQKIADIYETLKLNPDKSLTSSHVRHNLEGALIDLDRLEADEVCRNTIRRAIKQLSDIERFLPMRNKTNA